MVTIDLFRNFKTRPLTDDELNQLDKRLDEIDEALDLCVPGRDDDVVENLDSELEYIIQFVEKSLDTLTSKKRVKEYEKR